jgi:hypothetical protein
MKTYTNAKAVGGGLRETLWKSTKLPVKKYSRLKEGNSMSKSKE